MWSLEDSRSDCGIGFNVHNPNLAKLQDGGSIPAMAVVGEIRRTNSEIATGCVAEG